MLPTSYLAPAPPRPPPPWSWGPPPPLILPPGAPPPYTAAEARSWEATRRETQLDPAKAKVVCDEFSELDRRHDALQIMLRTIDDQLGRLEVDEAALRARLAEVEGEAMDTT